MVHYLSSLSLPAASLFLPSSPAEEGFSMVTFIPSGNPYAPWVTTCSPAFSPETIWASWGVLIPDLNRGAVGIERGTDEHDCGWNFFQSGNFDGGLVALAQQQRIALRNVGLGDHRGDVHHGEQRRGG